MKEIIPHNLDDCLDILSKNEDLDKFIKLSEEDAPVSYHHTTGQALRNNWGLWQESDLKKYFNSIGINHPDDMTGYTYTIYYR